MILMRTIPLIGSTGGIGRDSHWSSVKLLLGFEGSDGATGSPGMTDESPAAHGTATVVGDAQIDTGVALIGSSSLMLDGNGDTITFPDSLDWRLSAANSDQFTVECFVRFATWDSNTRGIMGHGGTAGDRSWTLTGASTVGNITFAFSTVGNSFDVSISTSGAGMMTGVKYHVAVDKDSSGKIRIYIDGVMRGSATPANSSMFNSASNFVIGGQSAVSPVEMEGWLDEIRITKGVARYASDGGFTAPTTAFPRS